MCCQTGVCGPSVDQQPVDGCGEAVGVEPGQRRACPLIEGAVDVADVEVLLEHRLPLSSRRVDAILAGGAVIAPMSGGLDDDSPRARSVGNTVVTLPDIRPPASAAVTSRSARSARSASSTP